MAILNWILTTLNRIHGRIVINTCVKYLKKIFIGVGDIHPDGQPRTDGRTDGAQIIILHKKKFLVGDNIQIKHEFQTSFIQKYIFQVKQYQKIKSPHTSKCEQIVN